MLEHVPEWLGKLLGNIHAGHNKLVITQPGIAAGARLDLTSPAFVNGTRLPERFTDDGDGVSPPLSWSAAPAGTTSFALIIEDPDAPAPQPLVHAVVWNLAAATRTLVEGALTKDRLTPPAGSAVGSNSFLAQGWLPPDPPTGHGSHDYVFQLFALAASADLGSKPGRSEVVAAMRGNVLATGVLVGTYSRPAHGAVRAPSQS